MKLLAFRETARFTERISELLNQDTRHWYNELNHEAHGEHEGKQKRQKHSERGRSRNQYCFLLLSSSRSS